MDSFVAFALALVGICKVNLLYIFVNGRSSQETATANLADGGWQELSTKRARYLKTVCFEF